MVTAHLGCSRRCTDTGVRVNHYTVQQALQLVADHPMMETTEVTQIRVHELVARSLFDIANQPDANVRGSLARANKARKIILDRLVGTRRPGSHPATRVDVPVTFVDLTGRAIAP